MGRNTLEEVLKHKPDIILEVYVNISEKKNLRGYRELKRRI